MANFDLIRQQFMEVVDNQLKADDPKETRQTLQRLLGLGYSEIEAKSLIAQCVANEMYSVFQSNAPYNVERYIATLHNLPVSPDMKTEV